MEDDVTFYIEDDVTSPQYQLPWDSPVTWIVAALGIDFCYYWVHRSAHGRWILLSYCHPGFGYLTFNFSNATDDLKYALSTIPPTNVVLILLSNCNTNFTLNP